VCGGYCFGAVVDNVDHVCTADWALRETAWFGTRMVMATEVKGNLGVISGHLVFDVLECFCRFLSCGAEYPFASFIHDRCGFYGGENASMV
jgi:hypothetical protein